MGFPILPELLTLICNHLLHQDRWPPECGYRFVQQIRQVRQARRERRRNIQSFRLVCKDFAAAGLPFLTSTAYLTQYHHDLDVLSAISQHPYISKQIRTMICDDSCLSFIETSDSVEITPYGDYCIKMYDEQRSIKCQGNDLAILCAALTQLPNLRSITVTDKCNYMDDSYSTPVRGSNAWKDNGLSPRQWPKKAPPTDVWDQASSPHHTFVTVVRALSIMSHKIHELYIEGRNFGMSHRIFDASPKDFTHLCNVFTNLRKVKLAINDHSERRWEKRTVGSGLIGNLLSTANSLESLRLDSVPPEASEESCPNLTLSTGLGMKIWPYLRYFALVGFYIDEHHDFVEFLTRHRATLREVEFNRLAFGDATWIETFAEIQQSSITWDKCVAEELLDPEIEYTVESKEIVQYLREGGKNPFADLGYQRERSVTGASDVEW